MVNATCGSGVNCPGIAFVAHHGQNLGWSRDPPLAVCGNIQPAFSPNIWTLLGLMPPAFAVGSGKASSAGMSAGCHAPLV